MRKRLLINALVGMIYHVPLALLLTKQETPLCAMDPKNLAMMVKIQNESLDAHLFIGPHGRQQSMIKLILNNSETVPCKMTGGTTEKMVSYVQSALRWLTEE